MAQIRPSSPSGPNGPNGFTPKINQDSRSSPMALPEKRGVNGHISISNKTIAIASSIHANFLSISKFPWVIRQIQAYRNFIFPSGKVWINPAYSGLYSASGQILLIFATCCLAVKLSHVIPFTSISLVNSLAAGSSKPRWRNSPGLHVESRLIDKFRCSILHSAYWFSINKNGSQPSLAE